MQFTTLPLSPIRLSSDSQPQSLRPQKRLVVEDQENLVNLVKLSMDQPEMLSWIVSSRITTKLQSKFLKEKVILDRICSGNEKQIYGLVICNEYPLNDIDY